MRFTRPLTLYILLDPINRKILSSREWQGHDIYCCFIFVTYYLMFVIKTHYTVIHLPVFHHKYYIVP